MNKNSTILISISEDELETLIAKVISKQLEVHVATTRQNESKNTTTYLTREETMQKLRVSSPTLNKWTKDGTIQGKRIGSRIRYCIEDIEAALKDIHSLKYKKK